MNKKIDLTQILKDCPKGFKLYSANYGEVKFSHIIESSDYPIIVRTDDGLCQSITKYGMTLIGFEDKGECTLFPSNEQRDWSKFTAPWYKKERFDPKTLKPFDKVLVRDDAIHTCKCNLFSNIIKDGSYPYKCVGNAYTYCIPYNDDTKHLVGTSEEAPKYYRYWED